MTRIATLTNGTTHESYSVTETAVELRNALKAAYPQIKFSVKSRSYSGGASIDVKWTDGPTVKMVDAIAQRFAGADFDGMIDLKTYHRSEYQGQTVSWGADFVFCSRTESHALMQAAADRVARRYGIDDMPPIVINQWGKAQVDRTHPGALQKPVESSCFDITDLVYQEARQCYQVNGITFCEKR